MSEFIQIDIKLLPVYGAGGFAGRFPNLARLLNEYGYNRVLEEEQTLYQLVDAVTRLRNDPAIPASAKAPIARVHDRIHKVREEAREHLLGRRLNELDRALYRLEDLFSELERELSW